MRFSRKRPERDECRRQSGEEAFHNWAPSGPSVTRFQRPSRPLSRASISGATSIRQKAAEPAARVLTIAARTTEACVTASVAPCRARQFGEPGAGALDQGRDRLATVRRGGGIVMPHREPVRLARRDIRQGETSPAPIIAVPERRLDVGVETQRRGRLARGAGGGGQHAIIESEPAAQRFESADGGAFERFVAGKPGRARRRGSAVRKEVETRGHETRAPGLGRLQPALLRRREIAFDPGSEAQSNDGPHDRLRAERSHAELP